MSAVCGLQRHLVQKQLHKLQSRTADEKNPQRKRRTWRGRSTSSPAQRSMVDAIFFESPLGFTFSWNRPQCAVLLLLVVFLCVGGGGGGGGGYQYVEVLWPPCPCMPSGNRSGPGLVFCPSPLLFSRRNHPFHLIPNTPVLTTVLKWNVSPKLPLASSVKQSTL